MVIWNVSNGIVNYMSSCPEDNNFVAIALRTLNPTCLIKFYKLNVTSSDRNMDFTTPRKKGAEAAGMKLLRPLWSCTLLDHKSNENTRQVNVVKVTEWKTSEKSWMVQQCYLNAFTAYATYFSKQCNINLRAHINWKPWEKMAWPAIIQFLNNFKNNGHGTCIIT